MKKYRKPYRTAKFRWIMRQIEKLLLEEGNRAVLDAPGSSLELVLRPMDPILAKTNIHSKGNLLKFRAHTVDILARSHFCYVEDIVRQTEMDIYKKPKCGRATLRDITDRLADRRVALANKVYISLQVM